jgi:hypothetical protein
MGENLLEVGRPWWAQGEYDGLWPLSKHSNGYGNALVVKSGPGKLYGFTVYNSGAAQFVLLFDSATLPAEGVPPAAIFPVATVTALMVGYADVGRAFGAGCVLCNSSTGPTKTIGAADCFFDVQYVGRTTRRGRTCRRRG